MSDGGPPVVKLYSRPGCHLCEEVRADLMLIAAEGVKFELQELNIEAEEDLHRAYLERIPVVEIDGIEIGELEIPRVLLRAGLERAASIAPDDSNG
jgi:glutaredoxin